MPVVPGAIPGAICSNNRTFAPDSLAAAILCMDSALDDHVQLAAGIADTEKRWTALKALAARTGACRFGDIEEFDRDLRVGIDGAIQSHLKVRGGGQNAEAVASSDKTCEHLRRLCERADELECFVRAAQVHKPDGNASERAKRERLATRLTDIRVSAAVWRERHRNSAPGEVASLLSADCFAGAAVCQIVARLGDGPREAGELLAELGMMALAAQFTDECEGLAAKCRRAQTPDSADSAQVRQDRDILVIQGFISLAETADRVLAALSTRDLAANVSTQPEQPAAHGTGAGPEPEPEPARPTVDESTFAVQWRGARCKLDNTMQFRLMKALCDSPNVYHTFTTLAERMDRDDADNIAPIKMRLDRALRASGMNDLADCIQTQTGHYGLMLP